MTMMSEAARTMRQETDVHIEGLRGLSGNAVRFLRQHPKEARIVVAAALEAAATQSELERHAAWPNVPKSLQRFVVRRSLDEDLISVSEAARRLQVSRTTLYAWVERKMLLGWKATRRGLIIPAAQILGPGRVVAGIDRVLEIIDDPELAWTFLSEEWPFPDQTARPIDKLKAGDIEEVADAAPSFGTAFT
jgi:excisionase family DNA binding protein